MGGTSRAHWWQWCLTLESSCNGRPICSWSSDIGTSGITEGQDDVLYLLDCNGIWHCMSGGGGRDGKAFEKKKTKTRQYVLFPLNCLFSIIGASPCLASQKIIPVSLRLDACWGSPSCIHVTFIKQECILRNMWQLKQNSSAWSDLSIGLPFSKHRLLAATQLMCLCSTLLLKRTWFFFSCLVTFTTSSCTLLYENWIRPSFCILCI